VLQRQAQVTALSDGEVTVRLLGSACTGCGDGCGGRCNLLVSAHDTHVALPRTPGLSLVPGQSVILTFSDRALRHAAYAGYGRALLALLVGATLGLALAHGSALPADPLVLIGLLLGVTLAARRTGNVQVNPTLTTPAAHLPSLFPSTTESQTPP